jgi:hypothetical protein
MGFERQFQPSDSAAMIQRTAASPLDSGRRMTAARCQKIEEGEP